MKVNFLVYFVFVLLSCNINCQDIKIIKATKQEWSGGVAGRYGENYYIELQTKKYKLIPDSLWMNGEFYKLNFSGANQGFGEKRDSLHHVITYSISIGTSHDEYAEPDMLINQKDENTDSVKSEPAKHFEGAALLTYMKKGIQKSIIIKEFQSLEPINYP